MKNSYQPEGSLLYTPENQEYISSISGLEKAFLEGKILESTVSFCDSAFRLHIDLGETLGIMDKEETLFCREGEYPKVGVAHCKTTDRMSGSIGKAIAYLRANGRAVPPILYG